MVNKDGLLSGFRGFNFDKDDKWQTYMKSVEIPGNNPAAALEKLKAKWYKKNVEPEFEPEWITAAAPKPASTATPSFTSSQPKPDTSFSQQQSSTRSTSQPSSTYAPATGAYAHLSQPSLSGLLAGKPDGSTEARRLLAFHISVLVLGLVAAVPIGSWSAKAYVMCLRATIIGMVYKIYVMYGMPTLRPLSGLMDYVQRVMPCSEFCWLVLALSFPGYPPYIMLLVPLWIASLYAVLGYLSRQAGNNALWKRFGAGLQQKLVSKQRDVLVASAGSEVMLGFVLVLAQASAVTRNIMLVFLYWNLLRIRYHVPVSSSYHHAVWSSMQQRTAPYIGRIPPLVTAISYAQRWFTSLPVQQQRP